MTSSNGNISALLAICAGNHRWIIRTQASDAELWCFFFIWAWINDWGWWFEMPPRPLWRQCNGPHVFILQNAAAGNRSERNYKCPCNECHSVTLNHGGNGFYTDCDQSSWGIFYHKTLFVPKNIIIGKLFLINLLLSIWIDICINAYIPYMPHLVNISVFG